jgi:hypothetical protein
LIVFNLIVSRGGVDWAMTGAWRGSAVRLLSSILITRLSLAVVTVGCQELVGTTTLAVEI